LPLDELKKNNVAPDEVLRHEYSERFSKLAAGVADRAKNFYRLARQTLPPEDRRSMVAAELMGSVYWQLLQKMEQQRFNIFGPELTHLNKVRKTALIFRAWLRLAFGAVTSNYGMP
jgi:phytoene synthase